MQYFTVIGEEKKKKKEKVVILFASFKGALLHFQMRLFV